MKKVENKGKKLQDLKKDIPFKIPEGYFDRFPTKLEEAIQRHDHVPSSRKILSSWKPYAAAAIIIVAAVLTGTFTGNRTNIQADQHLYSEISELVESELHSINEQTILEISEPEAQDLPANSTLNSDDDIIEYLLNEDIENELMNEL